MSKKRVSVAILGLLVGAACSAPESTFQAVVVPESDRWHPKLILVNRQTGELWVRRFNTEESEQWHYIPAPSGEPAQ